MNAVEYSPGQPGLLEQVPDGSEEQVTAVDYDRWVSGRTVSAWWMRFWFAPGRTIWLNTPVRHLARAISLKPSDRILDIGCGYGGMLIYLQRGAGGFAKMEGLDCSELMVERGRIEVQTRGLENTIHLRKGVATRLPYSDASFDVVLCTYVIKHLSDSSLRQMLSEVRRVLKPGGRFCFWEAAPSRWRFMHVWNLNLLRKGISVVYLRTMSRLREMLQESGFTDLKPYGNGLYYYYPPLPRVGFIAVTPGRK